MRFYFWVNAVNLDSFLVHAVVKLPFKPFCLAQGCFEIIYEIQKGVLATFTHRRKHLTQGNELLRQGAKIFSYTSVIWRCSTVSCSVSGTDKNTVWPTEHCFNHQILFSRAGLPWGILLWSSYNNVIAAPQSPTMHMMLWCKNCIAPVWLIQKPAKISSIGNPLYSLEGFQISTLSP